MMINNDDESFNSTSTHDSSRNNNEDAHRATGDFVIHLPTDVLLEHMIPFLDRQSICCLGRTNQKWYKSMLHSQEAGAFHYETGCYTIAKESSSRRCDVCIVQSSYTSISLKV